MRTDAQKNLSKVAGQLVKDPLLTDREIAKEVGIGKSTANRAKQELGQNGTIERNPRTVKIASADLDIVDSIQRITILSLEEIEAKVSQGEPLSPAEINMLASTAEKSQKRQAFLDGENSTPDGGEVSDAETIAKAKALLSDVL